MLKIAIIGCGNIGIELATHIKKKKKYRITDLVDVCPDRVRLLARKIGLRNISGDLHTAIDHADLIIEAASPAAVKEIIQYKKLDLPGKNFLAMSTGGLFQNADLVKKIKHCRIHIPSGAIAGLDAIKAVSGKIDSLSITTTKHARSLEKTPFVLHNKLDLKNLKTKKKIFKGNLKKAIEGFPQNINVAASLYLASHYDDIQISVVADPNTNLNTHHIECRGKFGEIITTTKNKPSDNPKTSWLAILSAISTLGNCEDKS